MTAKRLLVDSLDKNNMGLVTSPDGDSHIILNSKSVIMQSNMCIVLTGGGNLIDCALSLVVKLYV